MTLSAKKTIIVENVSNDSDLVFILNDLERMMANSGFIVPENHVIIKAPKLHVGLTTLKISIDALFKQGLTRLEVFEGENERPTIWWAALPKAEEERPVSRPVFDTMPTNYEPGTPEPRREPAAPVQFTDLPGSAQMACAKYWSGNTGRTRLGFEASAARQGDNKKIYGLVRSPDSEGNTRLAIPMCWSMEGLAFYTSQDSYLCRAALFDLLPQVNEEGALAKFSKPIPLVPDESGYYANHNGCQINWTYKLSMATGGRGKSMYYYCSDPTPSAEGRAWDRYGFPFPHDVVCLEPSEAVRHMLFNKDTAENALFSMRPPGDKPELQPVSATSALFFEFGHGLTASGFVAVLGGVELKSGTMHGIVRSPEEVEPVLKVQVRWEADGRAVYHYTGSKKFYVPALNLQSLSDRKWHGTPIPQELELSDADSYRRYATGSGQLLPNPMRLAVIPAEKLSKEENKRTWISENGEFHPGMSTQTWDRFGFPKSALSGLYDGGAFAMLLNNPDIQGKEAPLNSKEFMPEYFNDKGEAKTVTGFVANGLKWDAQKFVLRGRVVSPHVAESGRVRSVICYWMTNGTAFILQQNKEVYCPMLNLLPLASAQVEPRVIANTTDRLYGTVKGCGPTLKASLQFVRVGETLVSIEELQLPVTNAVRVWDAYGFLDESYITDPETAASLMLFNYADEVSILHPERDTEFTAEDSMPFFFDSNIAHTVSGFVVTGFGVDTALNELKGIVKSPVETDGQLVCVEVSWSRDGKASAYNEGKRQGLPFFDLIARRETPPRPRILRLSRRNVYVTPEEASVSFASPLVHEVNGPQGDTWARRYNVGTDSAVITERWDAYGFPIRRPTKDGLEFWVLSNLKEDQVN